MEDYFTNYNNVKKRHPGLSSLPHPSRIQSYPSYNPPRENFTEEWARYFGSCNLGYSQDVDELCLLTGSTARLRRGREGEIVEKFSELSLDDGHEDHLYNPKHGNLG